MGLFDKIRSKITSSDGKTELPSATFATRPDVVYAPVSGMLVSLKEVKDEVLPVALLGDGGYPYAVPLNYALKGDTLLFHCAREGHKLDAVKRCGKASFCVVSRADVTEEEYTTYFESVIAFGQVRVLGEEEKRGAIEAFSDRFVHRGEEERDREIGRFFPSLVMLEMRIEHMAGKRAIELVPRE